VEQVSIKLNKPFGPTVLEANCPMRIVDGINDLVDNMPEDKLQLCSNKYSTDPEFPNLLNRGFEIIYLLKEDVEELELDRFLLMISKEYLEYLQMDPSGLYVPPPSWTDEMSDIWVNRYFKGDITPPHGHAYFLSGVIILKLPEEDIDYDISEDPARSLEFMYNDEAYLPEQEVGKVYLFPSHLRHWVHFHTSDQERRTISFNIAI
tara:strand:- start:1218 stop:1835 length:618 start_codon:yes stop_codon:yes gene_type:complete